MNWRTHSPAPTTGRLRVHPGLAAAGLESAFARELFELVIRYATADTLVRFTVLTFAFDNWGLQRFDRSGAGWATVPIPALSPPVVSQSWLRQAERDSLTDPAGTIAPSTTPDFAALLRADALSAGTATPAVLAARDAILHFEHSAQTNAAVNDCGSCHLAGQARRWAERRGVSFAAPGRYLPPAGLDVAVDVPAELDGNLSDTLMFGWHRAHHQTLAPSISARVADESAEVVRMLRPRSGGR